MTHPEGEEAPEEATEEDPMVMVLLPLPKQAVDGLTASLSHIAPNLSFEEMCIMVLGWGLNQPGAAEMIHMCGSYKQEFGRVPPS